MDVRSRFMRTEMLLGVAGMARLAGASVAVFGIGGVGSFTAEALARAGVGHLTLVDNDCVDVTNINRQIHACTDTIGMPKVEAMTARIHGINPHCKVTGMQAFYLPENADDFFAQRYDYVVDAVDTVSAKIDLARRCCARGIPIISSMGAANKLDPTLFEVLDIYETKVDPLARVMRKKLKEYNVPHLKVVCSLERPQHPTGGKEPPAPGRNSLPGSVSFVPPVVGMIIAGEIIRDLLGIHVEVSA
ncbi:ThiF family protein [Selenomonas sp. oral taxon 137 str. F0430]|uniref:tRNA threonylcarbamoyladenosine dehydratase n=1 Tax=Selenomonas sp. oral taxon 137 TaxID=712531 RepID=UPI0001EB2091|nr:tRNA threonylcarbamoyladenosine dehydratase [Selenomonas sp. oral taxon 137]EFR40444.1 ThiF family protein [Selenomonas sp. oral taxon 137 str. F0430]